MGPFDSPENSQLAADPSDGWIMEPLTSGPAAAEDAAAVETVAGQDRPASASRRSLLLAAGAAGMVATAAACTSDAEDVGLPVSDAVPAAPTTMPLTAQDAALGDGTFALFSQTDLNFQTLFALGAVGQTGVAGEVTSVVAQANAASGGASYQSVYDAFLSMGNRLQESALEADRAGRRVTARDRYLRSAKYYAQALYWVLGTSTPDAEAEVYDAMTASFERGLGLMEPTVERLEIPLSDSSHPMPAWFLRPSDDGRARPTVIMNNGSDGQHVDMLSQGGLGALERGYNVLIFEGPGQGSMLFLHNIVFRPEWEQVITPIVDVLESRSDVASDQIAIRGISFGGELAPRAAAFEHRLAALIADPGSTRSILDYPAFIVKLGLDGGDRAQTNQAWNDAIIAGSTPEQLFALKKTLEIFSPVAHDEVKAGGHPTDWYDLSRKVEKYDLYRVAEKITAPTLVTQYEGDESFKDEPEALYGLLKNAKRRDLVKFSAVDGAQYHCGPMAPQVATEVCWDWLDEVIGR